MTSFTIIAGSHFKLNHVFSLKCSPKKIKRCFSGTWMELDDPFHHWLSTEALFSKSSTI